MTGLSRAGGSDELIEPGPALGLALDDPPRPRRRLGLQADHGMLVGADRAQHAVQLGVALHRRGDEEQTLALVPMQPARAPDVCWPPASSSGGCVAVSASVSTVA